MENPFHSINHLQEINPQKNLLFSRRNIGLPTVLPVLITEIFSYRFRNVSRCFSRRVYLNLLRCYFDKQILTIINYHPLTAGETLWANYIVCSYPFDFRLS